MVGQVAVLKGARPPDAATRALHAHVLFSRRRGGVNSRDNDAFDVGHREIVYFATSDAHGHSTLSVGVGHCVLHGRDPTYVAVLRPLRRAAQDDVETPR